MAKDPDRARRDEEARARHRALGGGRILARGRDGELHSYSPEEYGNSTHGLESQVRSVWGMTALAAVLVVLALVCLVAFVVSFGAGGGPAWLGIAGAVVLGSFAWIGGKAAMAELRAKALRRRRGLPDPIK